MAGVGGWQEIHWVGSRLGERGGGWEPRRVSPRLGAFASLLGALACDGERVSLAEGWGCGRGQSVWRRSRCLSTASGSGRHARPRHGSLHPVLGPCTQGRPGRRCTRHGLKGTHKQDPLGTQGSVIFPGEVRCPMKYSLLEAPLPWRAPVPPRRPARPWGALRGPHEPVFLSSNLEVQDQGWREPGDRKAGVGVIVC